MKILEKILALGIVIGLILKFSVVTGGDVLLMWAMLVLACLYNPLGFLFFNQIRLRNILKKEAYKDVSALSIIFAIVAGLGLSIVVIGSLFNLLNLTGANKMLLVGAVMTAVVFVIALFRLLKSNEPNSKFILWRTGIFGAFGLLMLFTPGLSIVKFQYRNHPRYIEAYTNYLADPRNDELYNKVELERNRIDMTDEEFKRYEESLNK